MVHTWTGVNLGDFRIRGLFTYLHKTKGKNVIMEPPKVQEEYQTEFSFGYKLPEGLLLAIGYRGAYGEENNHIGFIGLNTDFKGKIDFGGK